MIKILAEMMKVWGEAFQAFAQAFTPEIDTKYRNLNDFSLDSLENAWEIDAKAREKDYQALCGDWQRVGSYFPINRYYNDNPSEKEIQQERKALHQGPKSNRRTATKTLAKRNAGKRKRLGLVD